LKKYSKYTLFGIIGLTGCIAVVAGDIIGIALHEKHDPISDTISMLAMGKYGWIQDWGLDIFAVGLFALAIGLYLFKNNGKRWLAGLTLFVLMAITLILIAEHNQYAGRPGNSIHRTLVLILAGLFLLLNFLISNGLKKVHPSLQRVSLWIGGFWLLMAPLFPLVPDGWDGAYERLVCVLMVALPAIISYRLLTFDDARSKNSA
tara:strand:+ start:60 stop:671 length:612 start_codon:yes stop_codon:yes gene_type:complete